MLARYHLHKAMNSWDGLLSSRPYFELTFSPHIMCCSNQYATGLIKVLLYSKSTRLVSLVVCNATGSVPIQCNVNFWCWIFILYWVILLPRYYCHFTLITEAGFYYVEVYITGSITLLFYFNHWGWPLSCRI